MPFVGYRTTSANTRVVTVSCTSGFSYVTASSNRVSLRLQNLSTSLAAFINFGVPATTVDAPIWLYPGSTDYKEDATGTGQVITIEKWGGDVSFCFGGSTGKIGVYELLSE
jgi:hypothetical protein